jgi:Flp pilus assembly protein TadG
MQIATRQCRRPAAAAVEFAVILPVLLLLLLGIWEVGRIIHVEIILHNAARDAARVGAQAHTINATGADTQIHYSTGSPNIEDTVRDYLIAAGITDLTGLVVEFQYVEPTPSGTNDDPYLGVKNQRFRVRVTIPYDNVRWTTLTLINPSTLTAEVYWQCLVDDPFTVDTTLPGWSP